MFKGERRADLRVYTCYGSGEWGPTKRGINVQLEQAADLLLAAQAVADAARREQQQ
jgi:hypothetical protein